MINPQMMGMGGFPDVPTVEELWKQEKSKFRHWIILFGIAIIALTGLAITTLVLSFVYKGDIEHKIADALKTTVNNSEVERKMLWSIFVPYITDAVAFLFGTVYYLITVRESYKKKSFAYLSQWSTFIVGFAAMISAWNLLSLAWSHSLTSYTTELATGIFSMTFNVLAIVIYFIVSTPVAKIRKTFQISARVEELKKDPQFRAMQDQLNNLRNGGQPGMNNGAYGPGFGAGQAQAKPTPPGATPNAAQPVKPAQPAVSPEEKKLRGMSVKDLKSVAKELSISGYSTMQKQELINAIIRVTKEDN